MGLWSVVVAVRDSSSSKPEPCQQNYCSGFSLAEVLTFLHGSLMADSKTKPPGSMFFFGSSLGLLFFFITENAIRMRRCSFLWPAGGTGFESVLQYGLFHTWTPDIIRKISSGNYVEWARSHTNIRRSSARVDTSKILHCQNNHL